MVLLSWLLKACEARGSNELRLLYFLLCQLFTTHCNPAGFATPSEEFLYSSVNCFNASRFPKAGLNVKHKLCFTGTGAESLGI